MKRTHRGFRIYADFVDTYGKRVDIIESSLATEQRVWIHAEDGSAHLNAAQARTVRDALDEWLEDDPAGESTQQPAEPNAVKRDAIRTTDQAVRDRIDELVFQPQSTWHALQLADGLRAVLNLDGMREPVVGPSAAWLAAGYNQALADACLAIATQLGLSAATATLLNCSKRRESREQDH